MERRENKKQFIIFVIIYAPYKKLVTSNKSAKSIPNTKKNIKNFIKYFSPIIFKVFIIFYCIRVSIAAAVRSSSKHFSINFFFLFFLLLLVIIIINFIFRVATAIYFWYWWWWLLLYHVIV